MAYVITDECVSCGTCAGECPVEAIAEGDSHYEINPDVCVECGTCASVCPTEAITEESFVRNVQKRKSFADFLFLYIHTFQNLQRSQLLQSIFFYHCISMFQQKCFSGQGEGFLSAVLGKNVADLVEFLRFAA